MASIRCPIEAGHVPVFARAIGDEDLAPGDGDGGVPAGPTFTAAGAQFDAVLK